MCPYFKACFVALTNEQHGPSYVTRLNIKMGEQCFTVCVRTGTRGSRWEPSGWEQVTLNYVQPVLSPRLVKRGRWLWKQWGRGEELVSALQQSSETQQGLVSH